MEFEILNVDWIFQFSVFRIPIATWELEGIAIPVG